MKYRKLGKTGLNVSVIGLGTWQFGGEWGVDFTQKQADAIIGTAGDAGINLIDTAECYGNHLSEEMVGRAVEKERDRWIIATKFGHLFKGHLLRDQLWSAEDVKKQLEGSLKSLRTETIDIYQFHSGSNDVFDNQELWTMLDKQKKAGKIRHLGISISNSHPGVLSYQSSRAGEVGAEMLQLYYNRLDRRPEEEAFPACREQNLGVFARVPLASGFLSGKYKKGVTFSGNDVRASKTRKELDAILEEVEEIRKKEVPPETSMAAWALAWCLRDPVVTTVIPGSKNPDQVLKNAAAAELLDF